MRPLRRGATALVVAFMLVVMLAFVALIVDLGYLRLVHTELQVGADASAMAGAARLNKGASGLSAAASTAATIASYNRPNGDALVLAPNPSNGAGGDVVLGVWNAATQTFTPSVVANDVNAVKVHASNPSLTAFFSKVAFGQTELGAKAVAIATHTSLGAGEVPFYLPFAISRCVLDTWSPDVLKNMTFALSPSGINNTGWAAVNDHPSASWVKSELDGAMICMHQWTSAGQITSQCTSAAVGASVGLNNGDEGLAGLGTHIEVDGVPWDAATWGTLPAQQSNSAIAKAKYGNMLVGPLPVVDGGPSFCSAAGGNWNQSLPLVGFVWGAIYDVRTKGGASGKNVWLHINPKTVNEVGNWPGGGNWGVTATGPSEVVQ